MDTQHMMLIDNEKDFVKLEGMLLKLYGYKVSVFYDGPSALAAVDELHPDAILLDIGMPPIDGYEVCRRARLTARGEVIAIIALTGFGKESDINAAYEAGFDAHVLKAADIDQHQKC